MLRSFIWRQSSNNGTNRPPALILAGIAISLNAQIEDKVAERTTYAEGAASSLSGLLSAAIGAYQNLWSLRWNYSAAADMCPEGAPAFGP